MWQHMKQRCLDPNEKSFHYYGARGITVCDEWKDSYPTFKAFALSHGYKEGLSIERIDVNGHYTPANVRFIPLSEQCKNKTNTVAYQGLTQSEWARRLGVPTPTLCCHRKRCNCTLEETIQFYIKKRNIEKI
jgi:hypothetical protein